MENSKLGTRLVIVLATVVLALALLTLVGLHAALVQLQSAQDIPSLMSGIGSCLHWFGYSLYLLLACTMLNGVCLVLLARESQKSKEQRRLWGEKEREYGHGDEWSIPELDEVE